MRVAIVGGTGFIGRALIHYLLEQGDQVVLFSRSADVYRTVPDFKHVQLVSWPPQREAVSLAEMEAVVNLAGETINQRWNSKAKKRILSSRVETTRHLIGLIKEQNLNPKVLINASAVGYYGTSVEDVFTEESGPGADFLAEVTQAWEKEADQAAHYGVRVAKMRLGVVLGHKGGALEKMLLPYRLFVGGTLGSGQQWVSWVHIRDVARAIAFAMVNSDIQGPVNVTAPHPVRMTTFGQTVAKVLGRPHWLPAPGFALKLLLGEMSDLILKGQCVKPDKLLEAGFKFQFPHLEEALRDLV
ncbi:uncharacterized protein (TIGR01777 family) [Caldalkalibacillus uzonensis]|uniref:Uncharacterized protein (TIGR01777 family) n=1 Tax=Caldalkalibacillus uzonensis TaxID=353224 RepID=A0ABU0CUL0_9BACI|nr:TIGR01777 family oxidoreductase [Caldalkalibacillus uzonensis]MDQ0340040.1 uncharacterized protein (TIGR01777 family) [Caldalkalibacillus uzonensis]